MDSLVAKIHQSSKTILTNKDLALICGENDKKNLNAKTAYYTKQKVLIRLTRGVFAKNRGYNPKELATSIYTPSYISFETVLRETGVIFQHFDTIFVASKWTKTVRIDRQIFSFRKMKDVALFNADGIFNRDHYSIATPERAFLDMIYLFPNYYFDNLSAIDWKECERLVKIYQNKQLEKRLKTYRKKYAQ